MYFAKQPKETKKEKYSSEVGRLHSKFRYSLSMTSFLAMQRNSFNTFKTEDIQVVLPADGNEDDNSCLVPNAPAVKQPFWLNPGYVTSEHCISAANKL